jgi:two-component system sensor histidine kinase PhoQ
MSNSKLSSQTFTLHQFSINRRILLGAILVVFIFVLLTGFALNKAFYNNAMASLEEKLTGQVYLLMADSVITGTGALFLPGNLSKNSLNRQISNINGYITQADGQLLWRSNPDARLSIPPLRTTEHGKKIIQQYSIDNHIYMGVSIAINWTQKIDGNTVVYHVSDDLTDFNHKINNYRQSIWTLLGLMSFVLIISLMLMLRWGLGPLRKVAKEVEAIEQGEQEMIQQQYPAEIRPLTHNINQLIFHERAQQLRYHNALGDLAHSLKTPLSIIKAQTLDPDRPQDYQKTVYEAVNRMDQIVEYQLQRAATSTPSQHLKTVSLHPLVMSVINSMKKIYQDKQIHFSIDMDRRVKLKIDEGDFVEIAGNLIDNACKWCESQVQISMRQEPEKLHLNVTDDGPGIADDMIDEIMYRGVRADQLVPGHGVGLAIVRDIITAYGAVIHIGYAKPKGTIVLIEFNIQI